MTVLEFVSQHENCAINNLTKNDALEIVSTIPLHYEYSFSIEKWQRQEEFTYHIRFLGGRVAGHRKSTDGYHMGLSYGFADIYLDAVMDFQDVQLVQLPQLEIGCLL